MTYLQLMIKTLEFYIKEPFDEEYYEYWNIRQDLIPIWIQQTKKKILYLLLIEMKSLNKVDSRLIKALEKDLTTNEVSLSKTIEYAINATDIELSESPFIFDSICQICSEEIDENLKIKIAKELAEEYSVTFEKKYLSKHSNRNFTNSTKQYYL